MPMPTMPIMASWIFMREMEARVFSGVMATVLSPSGLAKPDSSTSPSTMSALAMIVSSPIWSSTMAMRTLSVTSEKPPTITAMTVTSMMMAVTPARRRLFCLFMVLLYYKNGKVWEVL